MSVVATADSDIFVDPAGGVPPRVNAVTLLGSPPDGDFRLSARVGVGFRASFDAGCLLLWIDETHWAKLCLEYSPQGQAMIVSVVCRGVADDANAFVVDNNAPAWLRISRSGRAYAFHASLDGVEWSMIRYFHLDDPDHAVTVGFEAQSPLAEGCQVTFDEIAFAPTAPIDLRDGS
ncbi:DUF1349 domain-containing protein [Spiractinospora alimapuensis]|nr:DUF1349 domain-containing protein [Spiractinospora alimapuensis]